MRLFKFTIIILVLLFYSSFAQVKKGRIYHPFSGKVVFSGEFGFTHPYTDYLYPVPKLLSRGTIEFYLPVRSSNALGLKVFAGLGNLNSYGRNDEEKFNHPNFNTNIFLLGTGVLFASRLGYSIPYISANISHLRINPKNSRGELLKYNKLRKYDLNITMFTLETGLRFLVEDFWSINMGLNWNATNSDFIDDLKANDRNDQFITLFFGVSLYYSGSNYNDTDGDGVIDCKDMCPNTPKGVQVDEFGCELKRNGKKELLSNSNKKIIKKNKSSDSTKISVIQNNKKLKKKIVRDSLTEKTDTKIVNQEKSGKKKSAFKKVKLSYNFSKEQKLPELFFTDGNLYCFQVAAFKTMNSAQGLKSKLKRAGHHPFIVKVTDRNKINWFKVRIGYFRTLKAAKKYKNKYGL